MSRLTLVLVPAALAACSKNNVQPISGQIAQATFPSAVSTVRASRPGAQPVEVAVGNDGGFTLSLSKGRQYQIAFLGGAGQPVLVMPRKAGGLDARFDVRGGGAPFDMGTVRFVGDPSSIAVAFRSALTQASDPSDTGEVECEDGKDARTGAVCVDEPEGDNNQCGDDDKGDQNGGTSNPAPVSAAVADKNLPTAIGDCSDDEGDDHEGDSEKEGVTGESEKDDK